jgi:hypothetical protein
VHLPTDQFVVRSFRLVLPFIGLRLLLLLHYRLRRLGVGRRHRNIRALVLLLFGEPLPVFCLCEQGSTHVVGRNATRRGAAVFRQPPINNRRSGLADL